MPKPIANFQTKNAVPLDNITNIKKTVVVIKEPEVGGMYNVRVRVGHDIE